MSPGTATALALLVALPGWSAPEPARQQEEVGSPRAGSAGPVTLRVRGRLRDEDGGTPAPEGVHFVVQPPASAGEGPPTRSGFLPTGADGYFALYVPLGPEPRVLAFLAPGRASRGFDLAAAPDRGPWDLGEVVLHAERSMHWLETLADDALAEQHRLLGLEGCLVEMARRGGERWIDTLERLLAGERARAAAEGLVPSDLEILTALCRARGRPDPLRLEVPAELEGTWPGGPTLEVRLRNEGPEAFGISEGAAGGLLDRLRVEALDQDGRPVPALARSSPVAIPGGGRHARRSLGAGGVLVVSLSPGERLAFRGAGTYRLRVSYHDRGSIPEDASLEGLVVSRSEEITLRLRAR